MFRKVLIVNRGLIQVNCIRAARELGAVAAIAYVADDKNSVGVRMADEAYELAGSDPSEAYRDASRIIELAVHIGADAVHPGYGFLAQSSALASALSERGITLITSVSGGPVGDLGQKPAVKAEAERLKIRVVPGSPALTEPEEIIRVARAIGYPIALKTTTGVGGRGIRVVQNEQGLREAVQGLLPRAEQSASGLFVERFFSSVRNIEFPVLRDRFGSTVVLPEVESSLQRRFQKLVMETPSSFSDRALIRQLAAQSRRLVEKLEIVGCASVEFLIDDVGAQFLELNCSIQPAHVATYEVTGLDLLKEQLRIHAGEPLSLAQEDIQPQRVALSVVLNAEDPAVGFAPSSGSIKRFEIQSGMGVSVYSTVTAGDRLSPYFDPALAHVVAADWTREDACNKLEASLKSTIVEGVKTNIPFLLALIRSEAFQEGAMHTGYIADREIQRQLTDAAQEGEGEDVAALIAALALHHDANREGILEGAEKVSSYSLWNLTSRLWNRNKMEVEP